MDITNSVLEDRIANLEGSLVGLKEEGSKLQESLSLKEECLVFLEGEDIRLSGLVKFQEGQVSDLTNELNDVKHNL